MPRVSMRMRLLPAAVAAMLLAAAVAASAGLGARHPARFEALGHLNPFAGYSGDVVAHGSTAYLSSWHGKACPAEGVAAVDVSNARRPRVVGRFGGAAQEPRLAGTWTEKTIVRRVRTAAFDGVLAATSVQACRPDAFRGFLLTDVTRPSAPRQLALVPLDPHGTHEIWLQARGGRVYVWTAISGSERTTSPDGVTPGQPDFRIFDVSDPAAPAQVGGWGAWAALGLRPDARGRFLDWNFVHSVIGNPAGTRAYLSYWDLGTVILDVSDPAHPRYLGRTARQPGDVENAHSAWLAAKGRVLLETHEAAGGTVSVYDVSRASSPRRLAALRLPGAVLRRGARGTFDGVPELDLADSVHDPKVLGTTGLFSWYRQGVAAFDLSRPSRPRFLARFLPPPTPDPEETFCPGASCVSVWGVYPTRKLVLASDMLGGLWVLRLRR